MASESRGRWEDATCPGKAVFVLVLGWSKSFSSGWLHLFDTYLMSVSTDLVCFVFFAKMLWEAMPNGVGEFLFSQGYHPS